VEVVVCPTCFELGCKSRPQITVTTSRPHEYLDDLTRLIRINEFNGAPSSIIFGEFAKYGGARCPNCGTTPIVFYLPTENAAEARAISEELARIYDEGRIEDFINELLERADFVIRAGYPAKELGDFELFAIRVAAKKLGKLKEKKERVVTPQEPREWYGELDGQKFYVECAKCGGTPQMTVGFWCRISSLGKVLDYRVEGVTFSCKCGSKDMVFREKPGDENRYVVQFSFSENGYRANAYLIP